MIFNILLVLFLVAANGFFVAAEFALVKVRLGEIRVQARKGRKGAKTVEMILGHLDGYLSACQLGITLASLGLGWVGEPMVARGLEPMMDWMGIGHDKSHFFAFPIAFATITFLHITIGEQVPKMYAIQRYNPTAILCGFPLVLFYKLFKPFIWILNAASNVMLRMLGIHAGGHGEAHTRDELRLVLLESAQGGHVSARERSVMENVLQMDEKQARTFMLPRDQIVFLDTHTSSEDNLQQAASTGHTRLPLCEGDLDHILGIIHVKDVFRARAENTNLDSLASLARKALIVHETIALDDLLLQFKTERQHLAILVDERGVVSGMITMENVLEQLVGQIQDEFDNESPYVVSLSEGVFEVNAACPLVTLSEQIAINVDSFDSDTVGGAIIEALGHIPTKGESVMFGNHKVTVLEADTHHALKVNIEHHLAAPAEAEDPTPDE